jgi:hypothetical protein
MNPSLFRSKPFHERVEIYNKTKNRIWDNEDSNIDASNSLETVLKKGKGKRSKNYFKNILANQKNFSKAVESLGSGDHDDRPYIKIEIFGEKFLALLDSGASISCLSGSAAKDFLNKNIPFTSINQYVKTAGGKKYKIVGKALIEIKFKNTKSFVELHIIPELEQDVYLGINFWKTFGLLNTLYKSLTEIEELSKLDKCDILDTRQKEQLSQIINLFPDFEKEGLGKTKLLEHVIEVFPETKPIKQRYFSVSPAIEKKIHAEIDRMLDLGIIEVASANCS